MRKHITPMNGISKFTKLYSTRKAQKIISNLLIFVVIGMVVLLSGCSLSHYYGDKSPIEIEQYDNPLIWKEVYQIEATLWPLEKKVNEVEKTVNKIEKTVNEIEKTVNKMRDELATTKLSSIQANKNIESLQAEIQQIKSESIKKEKTSEEKTSVDMIIPVEITNKKEMLKMATTKVVAEESKKAGPDIQAKIITDIKYYKVSDTHDKVLIYVNAMNNPKLWTLRGAKPRLILDFFNTRNINKEKYEINTDGKFIKRIRISSYKEPLQKVRVVFDMMPKKKYSVDQKFSKKENIYSFDIRAN